MKVDSTATDAETIALTPNASDIGVVEDGLVPVGSEVTQWKAGKTIRIKGEHKACDDGQENKYKHSTNIKMKK